MIKPKPASLQTPEEAAPSLRITEDADHYYVAIDRDQRERAKGIAGRSWNPEIRKWVYPRTTEVYQALVKEFSDQLGAMKLSVPKVLRVASEKPASAVPPIPLVPAIAAKPISAIPASIGEKLDTVESLLHLQLRLSTRIQERIALIEGSKGDTAFGPKNSTPQNASAEIRVILEGFEKRFTALLSGSHGKADGNMSPEDHVDNWLMAQITSRSNDDKTFVSVCKSWHLIEDYRSVVDDLEEKLKSRLREILDLVPSCRESLFKLINDAFDSKAINKEQSMLLGSFRIHRNKLSHESQEAKPRKYLRYLYAVSALALVWPELGKRPPLDSPDSDDDSKLA